MNNEWTREEDDILKKFFSQRTTEMTLFQKLIKINPNRSYEAMTRRLRRMKSEGWVKDKDKALSTLRVGYFDIEATSLNASFGYMLSWYIKVAGKNEYYSSVINKKEIFDEKFDERLVKELLEAFKNFDVIYTWYGSDRKFDIPFIRTRAYTHGLEDGLPNNMEMFVMDLWILARNKLKAYNNRLDTIARQVGIDNVKKTPLDPGTWVIAAVGNKEALDYISLHNKRDVQLLERVHSKLKKIERPIYRSI